MRTWALILNCPFSLFTQGRRSHLHSLQTCQEKLKHSNVARQHCEMNKRQGRERKRCLLNLTVTVYGTVKLKLLREGKAVVVLTPLTSPRYFDNSVIMAAEILNRSLWLLREIERASRDIEESYKPNAFCF